MKSEESIMCGRYSLLDIEEEILRQLYDVDGKLDLHTSYNIAPSQLASVIVSLPDQLAQCRSRHMIKMNWGLVPSWSKDSRRFMINARSETATDKPFFKESFQRRRCLVPASGWYEWAKQGEDKQAYYIAPENEQPFAFAGLWDKWQQGDIKMNSFTIMTKAADSSLQSVHHRMPIVLPKNSYEAWLDKKANVNALQQLLAKAKSFAARVNPVSQEINKPENDNATCILPV